MKKTAIVAVALLSGLLSAETIQTDLAAGGSLEFCGAKRGVEPVPLVSVKGVEGKFPQAVWQVKETPFTIFHPKKKMAFKATSSLTVKLKIQVEPGCPVKDVRLRVKDKDGESFQLKQSVDLKKGGVFEIAFPVDMKHVLDCWGGKPANKKMDQPLRFDSIVFIPPANSKPEIRITILSIEAVMK